MFTSFNPALYDTDGQRAFAQALFETGGLVEVVDGDGVLRRFATTFSAARVLGRRDDLLRSAATRRAA